MPEESCRKHPRVVEDNEIVRPQQVRESFEARILQLPGIAIEPQHL
jgi:hypothetical protein